MDTLISILWFCLAAVLGFVLWMYVGSLLRPHGWVIADGSEKKYRGWDSLGPVWVTNIRDAVYFARRQDAEEVFQEDEDAWHVLRKPLP